MREYNGKYLQEVEVIQVAATATIQYQWVS